MCLRRERRKGGRSRNVKDKDWILRKKDRARRQGKAVAHDSKYTARKRRPAF
jgi:18S rRNA (guanine1575-N7)-methyltransferase